jgi:tRNA dimethylallyltransferase
VTSQPLPVIAGAAGPPPLLVIAGPTASGKTALALEAAARLGAEIVGADSQQVYRYFDIGTAKPSAAQLAAVPHHLISVVEPLEAFSAARYASLADAAIADIHARGKRVVVVGGTGLYLKVLLHGVVPGPSADPALRAALEALADREGNGALVARLRLSDPATAQALHPSDRVRLIRAIEISEGTGKPASQARAEHAFSGARHPFTQWVLQPPREALYAAINLRARQMFEAGLVDEVRRLVEQGYRTAAPMLAVGYGEALAVLEGQLSQEEAIARVAQRTRNYAKRQLTWFRKDTKALVLTPPYALP